MLRQLGGLWGGIDLDLCDAADRSAQKYAGKWVAGLYDKSVEGIDAGAIDMALAMVQKMNENLKS
ncbi:hypothetical protein [[Flexibacter] sp. ATCC 35208]|uniref:hypothetical protein n=1 Tax=[Flexibacter] sp. ATCC 35208 TaxID=1936242 RepID=UPI0009CECC01|nr:hypothetical protein [[Flexibacter] sp. ATCC 35208]OMP75526.1 hypothetical protein BW716_29580 [[Flexibacter] sp. ATCC 35208]